MRHALLADIHANLHALEAVLEDARAHGCTAFHGLGDVVGYGAFPIECIDLLRGLGGVCVLGNHDEAAAGEMTLEDFGDDAAASLLWTRSVLDGERRMWLSTLRMVRQVRGITLVHASLDTPGAWGYVSSPSEAELSMACQVTPLCFVGHTHLPRVYSRGDGGIHPPWEEGWRVPADGKFLVNAGSVGQPRDGDPRACYVILDEEEGIVLLRRVAYDCAAASHAVRGAGLPERLAKRLLIGS
jgi:diadenosine tetraphosphatase ApaH/serine/threonine PP2A family protein phosphatase